MRALVWFRNDLRLHDNEALTSAVAQADELLLVYCIDPHHFENLPLGFRKMGVHRAQFLRESLINLRQRLQQVGGNLIVRRGRPEEIIPQLVSQYQITRVYAQPEVTSEETQTEAAVQQALTGTNCSLHLSWGLTLYHPDDLPFDPKDTPEPFKTFRHQGTKLSSIRAEYPAPDSLRMVEGVDPGEIPTLQQLGFDQTPSDTIFLGGETAGLQRLQHYLFDTEGMATYKWTRNQSLGTEYSTKFSAWLALGCLSPRRVYYAVREYESLNKKGPSTYKLLFELLWRDFYKFLGWKYGDQIFHPVGIYQKPVAWHEDRAQFDAWCQGETGIPFVDAHMHELNQTGFMSNRGRVNVSTYLARDLKINWTWGAAYFESLLVDYDVTSNWLNWYYQATVWRYTHVLWQSTKYDPEGDYVSHWLPALSKLPPALRSICFLLSQEEQQSHEFVLGKDYPAPILVPDQWQRMIDRLSRLKTEPPPAQ